MQCAMHQNTYAACHAPQEQREAVKPHRLKKLALAATGIKVSESLDLPFEQHSLRILSAFKATRRAR